MLCFVSYIYSFSELLCLCIHGSKHTHIPHGLLYHSYLLSVIHAHPYLLQNEAVTCVSSTRGEKLDNCSAKQIATSTKAKPFRNAFGST